MKLLHIDIETYPSKYYIWDPRTRYVTTDKLAEAGYTACWSAKWHKDDYVYFDAEWLSDDYIQQIHKMLDEADAVVHYNGRKFDVPTLNREFLELGLTPPSPYHQIDLYQTVKKEFNFLYNKLDYVAQRLNIGKKLEHAGMPLWTACEAGDTAAQQQMQDYNIEDVLLLEDLYTELLPWISSHPVVGLYNAGSDPHSCPTCGSTNLRKEGHAYTRLGKYQQYQCKDCGRWSRGKRRLSGAELR